MAYCHTKNPSLLYFLELNIFDVFYGIGTYVYLYKHLGVFCGHLVYFMAKVCIYMNIWEYFVVILYILWLSGIFLPVLVRCTKKYGNPSQCPP
jgi:hypothetical protein